MKPKEKQCLSRSLTVLVMLFSFGVSLAWAGGEVLNGDYCQLKGSVCSRVNFQVAAAHPGQEELVQMLQKAQLPTAIYNEMMHDLFNTAVIYSDEVIKFEELRKRFGSVYSDRHIHPNYMGPGYDAGPLETLYVRALTQNMPVQTVYFSKLVQNMSLSEQIVLTLHEQAHRLRVLGERRFDERFAEGWAQSLYSYLSGKISKDQFVEILRAHKLPTNFGEFTDVTVIGRPAGAQDHELSVRASIKVLLGPKVIKKTVVSDSCTYLEVDKAAFSQFQQLADSPWVICFSGITPRGTELLLRYLQEKEVLVPVRVNLIRKTIAHASSLQTMDEVTSLVVAAVDLNEMIWSKMAAEHLGPFANYFPKQVMGAGEIGWHFFIDLVLNPKAAQYQAFYKDLLSEISKQMARLKYDLPFAFDKIFAEGPGFSKLYVVQVEEFLLKQSSFERAPWYAIQELKFGLNVDVKAEVARKFGSITPEPEDIGFFRDQLRDIKVAGVLSYESATWVGLKRYSEVVQAKEALEKAEQLIAKAKCLDMEVIIDPSSDNARQNTISYSHEGIKVYLPPTDFTELATVLNRIANEVIVPQAFKKNFFTKKTLAYSSSFQLQKEGQVAKFASKPNAEIATELFNKIKSCAP